MYVVSEACGLHAQVVIITLIIINFN